MRDLYSNIGSALAIVPAVPTAAAGGSRRPQRLRQRGVHRHHGAITGGGDFGVRLQESDTATPGDFTDAPAGFVDSNAPRDARGVEHLPARLQGEQAVRPPPARQGGGHQHRPRRRGEASAHFNVREVAFDPTYGRSMMADLNEDGITAVEFRQGWVSMAPAVKELERVILAREMLHGGHPVLRWNFANVQVETDKAGNRMMHKGKSGNKIDGAVACAMAVSRASMGAETSVYDADWFTEEMGYA